MTCEIVTTAVVNLNEAMMRRSFGKDIERRIALEMYDDDDDDYDYDYY